MHENTQRAVDAFREMQRISGEFMVAQQAAYVAASAIPPEEYDIYLAYTELVQAEYRLSTAKDNADERAIRGSEADCVRIRSGIKELEAHRAEMAGKKAGNGR